MSGRVLVVQHQDACPPGLVGAWLTSEGVDLDVRRPYAGEPLPADLTGHAGLVVLGGHMGAGDDAQFPWLTATKELVREAAARRIPVLGICLGHQLAAVALGGEVVRNPAGPRRGVLAMGWLPAVQDDPVLAGCGDRAVRWHEDLVSRAPAGTRVLARADTGELLAARFADRVWGVQCHPEADVPIVTGWAALERRVASEGDERRRIEAARAEVERAQDELRETWRPLAVGFAVAVAGREAHATGSPSLV